MSAVVLSVLLPVRNGAGTIGLAVRSTLKALPDNAELLVVDDASTDGTRAVLEGIRDPRLRVQASPEPLGVAVALNRMLDEAGGTFVARMDADDVTLPGRFARQVRALRAGADVVFAGHLRFGGSLRAYRQKRMWHLSAEAVRVWLALENPLTHPTMAGRARVVRDAGGYRPGPAEDYDLWLRLATAGARIERLASPAIGYRISPAQITMGERYLSAVLHDTSLSEAHGRHARRLGWDGDSVWPVLAAPARTEEEHVLKRRYWAFLTDRSRELPAFEGGLLRRRLEKAYAGAPGLE